MNNLSNSSVNEDRYIAHLAGNGGTNPIGWSDSWNAGGAKKHPIGNSIGSTIDGLVGGLFRTGALVTAATLSKVDNFTSVFGSKEQVCVVLGQNLASLGNLVMRSALYLDTIGLYPMTPKERMDTYGAKFVTGVLPSWVSNAATYSECVAKRDEEMGQSRAINLLGSVGTTIDQNYAIVSAVALGLILWTAKRSLDAAQKREVDAEQQLINLLSDRYAQIGSRMKANASDAEVQAAAQKILQRRLEINQEVKNLQLPNLRWVDIENITKPVFEAAEKIVAQ